MAEPRNPLDAALDLFVFVPVGLAMTAAEELPKMAAKGRSRVTTQITMARVVGQFAVNRGRSMIEQRLEQMSPSVPARRTPPAPEAGGEDLSYDELLGHESTNGSARPPLRAVPDGNANGAAQPDEPVTNAGLTDGDLPGGAPASAGLTGVAVPDSGAGQPDDAPSGPKPSPSSLAIPGYDSLSASQVVQRLAGLSRDELAAVGAYEEAHRGRRTILNRVSQLQGQ